MEIFSDITHFFKFLNIVDIIFLVAIIVLLILIVTLIYFIKINRDVFTVDDFLNTKEDKRSKEEMTNKIEEVEEKNLNVEEYNDEEGELLDLESLTKKLKEEDNKERISFTEYEKDQEEKAIISYDELLLKKNKYAINYEKEEMIDDLLVKKVDLNDLINKNGSTSEEEEEVRVISYQKEEAFLSALKELNNLLN